MRYSSRDFEKGYFITTELPKMKSVYEREGKELKGFNVISTRSLSNKAYLEEVFKKHGLEMKIEYVSVGNKDADAFIKKNDDDAENYNEAINTPGRLKDWEVE